jgi:hypothetical protein
MKQTVSQHYTVGSVSAVRFTPSLPKRNRARLSGTSRTAEIDWTRSRPLVHWPPNGVLVIVGFSIPARSRLESWCGGIYRCRGSLGIEWNGSISAGEGWPSHNFHRASRLRLPGQRVGHCLPRFFVLADAPFGPTRPTFSPGFNWNDASTNMSTGTSFLDNSPIAH